MAGSEKEGTSQADFLKSHPTMGIRFVAVWRLWGPIIFCASHTVEARFGQIFIENRRNPENSKGA